MIALAVVSNYVVTNRAPYLKCDPSVSVYVAVVWPPDHPTGPDLREGLCQTMLLVTNPRSSGVLLFQATGYRVLPFLWTNSGSIPLLYP